MGDIAEINEVARTLRMMPLGRSRPFNMSKKALIVSATGLSGPVEPAEEPNAAHFRRLLRRPGYGFAPDDIYTLHRPDLKCSEVMAEISQWLVPGAVPGDIRLLVVTAHGGRLRGPDQQPELSFGFPGDADTITDARLKSALAPLVAAGVHPWTCFDVCAELSAAPAEFLQRFQAKQHRLLDLLQPMDTRLRLESEPQKLQRFRQWAQPPVPEPKMIFPNSGVNSISFRSSIDSTSIYYENWGGVFTRNLLLVAHLLPAAPADEMIKAIWRAMWDDTHSQTPMLTGEGDQFGRTFLR